MYYCTYCKYLIWIYSWNAVHSLLHFISNLFFHVSEHTVNASLDNCTHTCRKTLTTCLNDYSRQRIFLLIWKSVVGKTAWLPDFLACQRARRRSPVGCCGDAWSDMVFHELQGKLSQGLEHLLLSFFFPLGAYRAVFLTFSYSSHSQLLCIFFPFINMIS